METCRTCKFFNGDAKGGDCRRYPPTMVLMPAKSLKGMEMAPSSAFPPVTQTARCGEHQLGVMIGHA